MGDASWPASVPGRALVAVRFVIGAAAWFLPVLTMRLLGLDPEGNPQAAYVARLFAVRDAALGAGIVATRGDHRRLWWKIGIACDLADAAAGTSPAGSGSCPRTAGYDSC
ncbi:MAG: hypothetical protein ACRDQ2_08405 [Gaiellales bacterium]